MRGMMTECAVNLHNLQTVPQSKWGAWITTLSPERMAEVEQAIQFALGMV